MFGLKILTADGKEAFNSELPVFEVRYTDADYSNGGTTALMRDWWWTTETRQALINQGFNLDDCLRFAPSIDVHNTGGVIVGPPIFPSQYGINIKSSNGDITLSGNKQILQTVKIVKPEDWVFYSDVADDANYLGFRLRKYRVPLDGATHELEAYLTRPYVHNHDSLDNPFDCGSGLALTGIYSNLGVAEHEIEYRSRVEEIDHEVCDLVTDINQCRRPTILLAKLTL